ncbi:MAG: PrsW family intramembrane metalloprotease [Caldilineaceae bacterium]|nr:PrsW family intramembrane metalloprotease [Caldilineaceae bacterium]
MDNLIDPMAQNYLFYDFHRKSFLAKVILAVVVAAALIFSLLFGWSAFFDDLHPLEVWLWIPYAIIGSLVAYFILSFLDRERRVRFFHIVTILSVPLILQPIASYLNDHSPAKFWTVGFYEEGLKILPVVLLAIYVPNLIRTRKDGIVYGALAGMGFNILEMGLYLARVLHEYSMIETWYQQSTRLGLFGFGGHIIWSAFVGMGVGFAAE